MIGDDESDDYSDIVRWYVPKSNGIESNPHIGTMCTPSFSASSWYFLSIIITTTNYHFNLIINFRICIEYWDNKTNAINKGANPCGFTCNITIMRSIFNTRVYNRETIFRKGSCCWENYLCLRYDLINLFFSGRQCIKSTEYLYFLTRRVEDG